MRRRLALVIAALLGMSLLAPTSGAAGIPATGAGVITVYRDPYGVPHIVAETREALAFGAGHVLATDRLFLTDVIRRLGQGRLAEILGPDMLEADMAMRREFYDPADIRRQYEELPAEVQALLVAFSDGFNTALAAQMADPTEMSVLFPALGYVPEPWTPEDSVTVLMLFTIVTFAGEGAGGELANAELLATLVDEHGGDVDAGLAVWQDLLLRNDPDAPAVIAPGEGPEPTVISADEPGEAQLALVLDAPEALAQAARAEEDLIETVRAVLDGLPVPKVGSYMLAADGSRTASGRPVILGAPQAGFLAPALFYEWGLHGPGIDCTGMTVPGLGPFVGIGWCNDHVWSFVAGNAGDQVDLYVESLCGDDLRGYLFEGECIPMETREEVYVAKETVTGPSVPEVHVDTVSSTVHGPVFHFDDDAGLAFVFSRAQAGHFAQSFEALMHLNFGQSFDDVLEGVHAATATYNALVAHATGGIGYFFTGFQPVRHEDIDHRLPVPGTGGFEWEARSLPVEQRPHVVNPSSGILNVNQGVDSKPISWWPRSSSIFVGRVSHTRADQEYFADRDDLDIDAVKDANREIISDVDLITPQLDFIVEAARELLEAGAVAAANDTAMGARLEEAFGRYDAWRDDGYPRVDGDGDGKLDDPAISIFGGDYFNFPRSPVWERWISEVWAELGRTPPTSRVGRLGMTVAAIENPDLFTTLDTEGWEEAFVEAMVVTLDQLEAEFGTDQMDEWLRPAPQTRIDVAGVLAPPPMPVQDHGSYSLIVDFGDREGVSVLPPGNGRADRAVDVAHHELTGEFPRHFVDQIDLYVDWDFKAMRMTPAQFTQGAESVEVFVYPGRPI